MLQFLLLFQKQLQSYVSLSFLQYCEFYWKYVILQSVFFIMIYCCIIFFLLFVISIFKTFYSSYIQNPSDSLKRLEDAHNRIFINKLLHFFKPSSKEFSEMEFEKDNGRQICVTGCHLLEFCLELDEVILKYWYLFLMLVTLLCNI